MSDSVLVRWDISDDPCPHCKRPVRWRVMWSHGYAALLPDELTGGPHACSILVHPTPDGDGRVEP